MNIEWLKTEGTPGTEYYEDGIRYIDVDPYGMDHADEFFIYLPGAAIADLPEGFLSWVRMNCTLEDTQEDVLPSGFYGLYNAGGEEGFVGLE